MWPAAPMRRKDRALPAADALALLQRGEYGVLASADVAGLPLATPLNYVLMDDALYFHCAPLGHKLSNIGARSDVSFCVVGATRPVYDGDFTTYYESAVVHGAATLVADDDEKRRALLALCQKYLPDDMDKAPASLAKSFGRTAVVRIAISRLTGKAKRPPAGQ
ncbi:MAG: pyridoxamine 5'-phosphate oxidase family protein [Oscillospiraceae bacterium]